MPTVVEHSLQESVKALIDEHGGREVLKAYTNDMQAMLDEGKLQDDIKTELDKTHVVIVTSIIAHLVNHIELFDMLERVAEEFPDDSE